MYTSKIFPYRPLDTYGRFIRQIGKGAFSTVYKFQKNRTSTAYALKEISFYEEGPELCIPQFMLREIAAMRGLRHPNVLPLLDIIMNPDSCFLVLPFADGNLFDLIPKSLHDRRGGLGITKLPRNKKHSRSHKNFLTPERIRDFTFQIAKGLAYCNSQNVWNRDIKPANILYFKDPPGDRYRLVISDFGLAKTMTCGTTLEYYTEEVYSMWYRAPEILLGAEYDATAEVWGLACVILEMYLHTPPFQGIAESDQLDVIFQIVGTPNSTDWPNMNWESFPIWSSVLEEELVKIIPDTQLRDLLQKMLVVNPAKRIRMDSVLAHPYFDSVRTDNDTFGIEFVSPETQLQRYIQPIYKVDIEDSILLYKKHTFLEKIANLLAFAEKGSPYHQSFRIYFLMLHIMEKINDKISEENLDLFGLACFDIAQKFIITNAIMYPDIVSLGTLPYSPEELVNVEMYILYIIDFDLNISLSYDFLVLYRGSVDITIDRLSMALLFLTTITPLIYQQGPSEIAKLCLRLAQQYYKSEPFSEEDIKWLNEVPNQFYRDIFYHISQIPFDQFKDRVCKVQKSDGSIGKLNTSIQKIDTSIEKMDVSNDKLDVSNSDISTESLDQDTSNNVE